MKIVEIRISESKQLEKINRINVLFKEIENCGQLISRETEFDRKNSVYVITFNFNPKGFQENKLLDLKLPNYLQLFLK